MQPVGQHIQINKPERINKSHFITEKEPLSVAEVVAMSCDISAPFKVGVKVLFYTDREIYLQGNIYLNIETVLLYFS